MASMGLPQTRGGGAEDEGRRAGERVAVCARVWGAPRVWVSCRALSDGGETGRYSAPYQATHVPGAHADTPRRRGEDDTDGGATTDVASFLFENVHICSLAAPRGSVLAHGRRRGEDDTDGGALRLATDVPPKNRPAASARLPNTRIARVIEFQLISDVHISDISQVTLVDSAAKNPEKLNCRRAQGP